MQRSDFVQISGNVLRPRLPCLGLIKIGGKGEKQRKNGKEWYRPTKYNHFKVTLRDRGTDGNYIIDRAVHDVLATNEPKELDIRFLFNEVSQNWQSALNAYDGRKLRCLGNGEKAFDRVLGREIPCTCPLLKQHAGDYPKDIVRPSGIVCKPYGVLSVLLEAARTYGGYHVFRTTSWETISAITAALELFKSQFGILSFVPFKLVIYPRTVTYEQGGEEKQGTSYSASVVLRESMDTAYQIAAAAREKNAEALQLTSGTYTPEVHQEELTKIEQRDESDVADEFHPNIVDAEVILEEEVDPVEQRIRRALEIGGTDKATINKKLAKYSDRLGELADNVAKHFAAEWEQARIELEAAALSDVDVISDEEDASGVQAEKPEGRQPAAAVSADHIPDLFE